MSKRQKVEHSSVIALVYQLYRSCISIIEQTTFTFFLQKNRVWIYYARVYCTSMTREPCPTLKDMETIPSTSLLYHLYTMSCSGTYFKGPSRHARDMHCIKYLSTLAGDSTLVTKIQFYYVKHSEL